MAKHSYKRCLELAKDCSNYSEFWNLHKDTAYRWLLRTNKLERFQKEFNWKKKSNAKYSYDECLKSAKSCNTHYEFVFRFNKAYKFLSRNCLLEKFIKDTGLIARPSKHSYEKCLELAKSCKDYKDFRETYNGPYLYLLRNGVIKQFKIETGWQKEKKLIDESILKEARKKIGIYSNQNLKEIEKLCRVYMSKVQNKLPRGKDGYNINSLKKEGSITNSGFTLEDIYQEMLIAAFQGIHDWFVQKCEGKEICDSPMFYAARKTDDTYKRLLKHFYRKKDGELNHHINNNQTDLIIYGEYGDYE